MSRSSWQEMEVEVEGVGGIYWEDSKTWVKQVRGEPASEAEAVHFLGRVFQKSLLAVSIHFPTTNVSPLVTWLSPGA